MPEARLEATDLALFHAQTNLAFSRKMQEALLDLAEGLSGADDATDFSKIRAEHDAFWASVTAQQKVLERCPDIYS